LHNLYTLESSKITVNNIKIPNPDTIVYHGTFNEDFKITYKYGIEVREDKLLTYSNGQDKIYFNPIKVKEEISKHLSQYTDIGESLDKNLTVSTNVKTVNDLDYNVSYSLESTISMEKWY
jgi:hypothetical protein